jgi:hypothetical protein
MNCAKCGHPSNAHGAEQCFVATCICHEFKASPTDPEVHAINVVCEAMADLDDEARSRVAYYMVSRYGGPLETIEAASDEAPPAIMRMPDTGEVVMISLSFGDQTTTFTPAVGALTLTAAQDLCICGHESGQHESGGVCTVASYSVLHEDAVECECTEFTREEIVDEPAGPLPTLGSLGGGLYRIHWYDGGSSLAAIGVGRDGGRWVAPTNWVAPQLEWAEERWAEMVASVERLEW